MTNLDLAEQARATATHLGEFQREPMLTAQARVLLDSAKGILRACADDLVHHEKYVAQMNEVLKENARLMHDIEAGEREIQMLKAANPGLAVEPPACPKCLIPHYPNCEQQMRPTVSLARAVEPAVRLETDDEIAHGLVVKNPAYPSPPKDGPAPDMRRYTEPTADGYCAAFYQIAELLDMTAMPISPKEAFETVMLPRLRELLAVNRT